MNNAFIAACNAASVMLGWKNSKQKHIIKRKTYFSMFEKPQKASYSERDCGWLFTVEKKTIHV